LLRAAPAGWLDHPSFFPISLINKVKPTAKVAEDNPRCQLKIGRRRLPISVIDDLVHVAEAEDRPQGSSVSDMMSSVPAF